MKYILYFLRQGNTSSELFIFVLENFILILVMVFSMSLNCEDLYGLKLSSIENSLKTVSLFLGEMLLFLSHVMMLNKINHCKSTIKQLSIHTC